MECRIIENEGNIRRHSIAETLETLLTQGEERNIFALSGGFCCLDGDVPVIIYSKDEAAYLFYAELQLKEGFLYFVENFISPNTVGMRERYGLLLAAEQFGFTERDYFPLFNLLKWQSSRKGLDYFMTLKQFTPSLRELVLGQRAALNEAYLFHNSLKGDVDEILKAMEVKLSFSETNRLLRSLAEFARKSGSPAGEIAIALAGKEKSELFDTVQRLRYPFYSAIKARFTAFIGAIKLPAGAKLSYDESFERESYTLELNFKDFKSLKSKLKALSESLDRLECEEEFVDYFRHSNLFSREDKDR